MSAATGRPRLAIGPANYAGQAFRWAEAVRTHLPADAWSFSPQRARRAAHEFRVDRIVGPATFYNPLARRLRAARLISGASHLIIDGFRPLLYDRAGFESQARYLREHGPSLGLLAHGSDVRDPDAHRRRNAYSYFDEGDDAWSAQRGRSAARNREAARALGVGLFVSTPDLLFDLPEATWVPVCVDVGAWASHRPVLESRRPRVLFIPSQRTPPIKGTRHIDPVLRRLDEAGVITYVAPDGVPHAQMRELVGGVDVVIDQLLAGSYGVAAVEAMAAGRVVIGNIDSLSGLDVETPRIVSATPATLEETIVSLVDRADELRADADANRAFVEAHHDGRVSAQRLARFLGLAH